MKPSDLLLLLTLLLLSIYKAGINYLRANRQNFKHGSRKIDGSIIG